MMQFRERKRRQDLTETLMYFRSEKTKTYLAERKWEWEIMEEEVVEGGLYKPSLDKPPFVARFLAQLSEDGNAVYEGRTFDRRPIYIHLHGGNRMTTCVGKIGTTVGSSLESKGWDYVYTRPASNHAGFFWHTVETKTNFLIDWSQARIVAIMPKGATH